MLAIQSLHKTTLLINPPLWNAYAPHLAVPLLAGVLRSQGMPARSHDASIAVLDWILSAEGQHAIGSRLAHTGNEHLAQRAKLVHPHVVANVDRAKAVIRDLDALHDSRKQAWARTVMRNAMWCVSAAFDGLNFDLVANQLYYSATSTGSVLAALDDPERNVYRWALDYMIPADLLSDPDIGVVGLSVSADTQLIAALTIAKYIRRLRPNIRVIMGGNYTTRMVDRWQVRHPFFDLIDAFVMSEGEEVLPQIVRRYGAGQDVADLPGVVTAHGDSVSRLPARPVRLDHVPAADFTDLPLQKYFAPGPIIPLYASRSCAWSCAFCSIPFASNNFRRQPAQVTVDHLEAMQREYGAQHFMFVDEILTLNVLRDVATEIVARGLDIYWYGETRFARGIDQGLADLLYASGCRRLNFGLESYNQRVLDLMQKGTKVAHIDSTVEAMLRAGIPPHLFVIHGFPGETQEEANHTVAYARSVVDRSEREFDNPYTTWGGAPFVLDVHSPVAREPERFGVTIIDPPESEDLSLARDYVTHSGIGREQAERLAVRARDSVAIRQNVWFRSGTRSTLAEVEEFTFLRACRRAPNAAPRTRRLESRRIADDDTLSLTGSCETMPWPADAAQNYAAVALYNGDQDTFVQLNWPVGVSAERLRGFPTVHELADFFTCHGVKWGEATGRELVCLLERHGLVTSSAADVVPIDDWAQLAAEPGVLEATEDDAVILHSPSVGNTVRLGPVGHLVWLLCSQAPSTIAALGQWLLGEGLDPSLWDDFRSAVESLLELGFLFAVAPQASAVVGPPPRETTVAVS